MLTRGVEQLAELPRGASGVGEMRGGLVDDPAGIAAAARSTVDGDRAPVIGGFLPGGWWSGQWGDAVPGDGQGQPHRFAGGLADMRVV